MSTRHEPTSPLDGNHVFSPFHSTIFHHFSLFFSILHTSPAPPAPSAGAVQRSTESHVVSESLALATPTTTPRKTKKPLRGKTGTQFHYSSITVPLQFHYSSTSSVPVPRQFHASSTPVPCQFHASSMPVPRQFHASSMPVPCQFQASSIPCNTPAPPLHHASSPPATRQLRPCNTPVPR